MLTTIRTTHGMLDKQSLGRIVFFEDNPNEFVVREEWWLVGHDDATCEQCATDPNTQRKNGSTLVRRDAHVILKEPSVTATAVTASLG